MILRKIFIGFLFVAFSFQTLASTDSVFGLNLGFQFTIPECIKSSYGYEALAKNVCYQNLLSKSDHGDPLKTETVLIQFPVAEVPNIISGMAITGLIIDGKLEGIGFNTHGISDQDDVLRRLTEKYGKPQVYTPHEAQNMLGAKFKIFTAMWKLPNLVVTYQSTTGSTDSGLVLIDTDVGSKYRMKQLKSANKHRREL